jgi:predicted small lipoprotein YifL
MNRIFFPRPAAAGLALALALAAGCGDKGPKLYPVRGKVALKDGTAIKYGHVIFHPDASKGNTSKEVCQGTITDGEYVIKTGAKDGAPAGAYKVSIEAANIRDPANPYFTEWLADEKYVNLDTSGLKAEVTENADAGKYDFVLDPHPHAAKQAAAKAKTAAASGVPKD